MAMKRKAGSAPIRKWDGSAFRILALDPGGTTGWAMAQASLAGIITYEHGQIGPHEHHEELFNALTHSWFPDTVICESFEFRQHINQSQAKTGVELISKEYIGVVKLWAELESVPVVFQTASAAKSLIPDKGPQAHEKLKALGLYQTNMKHANDAYRHLLKYMVTVLRIREPITDKWL